MPDLSAFATPLGLAVLAAGLGLGLLLGWLIGARRSSRRQRQAYDEGMTRQAEKDGSEHRLLEERLMVRDRELQRSEDELRALTKRFDSLDQRAQELSTEHALTSSEAGALAEQLSAVSAELKQTQAELKTLASRETELKTRMEETQRAFAEKEALFTETSDALKGEFQLLANRIFEQQGETFAKRNQTQLEGVLNPFREQISDFKKRVEEVYHTESKDRASLLTEVRGLQRASEKINEEAESLTKALKGDKRIQGNWGELVLERVLEDSGLRRDHEYQLQATLKSDSGDTKRPDVIIHLPDDKDVVVDAKVSLVAYERALAAEDDAVREQMIKQHVNDLRAQVKRLAEQDYDRLQGLRSLDFVLLFVPIESAFTLAMEQDPAVFTEAFNKRIVIVSPTTLMMTLRIIHNVWRYEKQSKNAQEIAKRAGALYDKLRGVMEEMTRLGTSLKGADAAYDSAMKRLATGRGNLVRHVEALRELGASPKKPFDKELLDTAEHDGAVDVPTIAAVPSVSPVSPIAPEPPEPEA